LCDFTWELFLASGVVERAYSIPSHKVWSLNKVGKIILFTFKLKVKKIILPTLSQGVTFHNFKSIDTVTTAGLHDTLKH
jgi:hypothetical protein